MAREDKKRLYNQRRAAHLCTQCGRQDERTLAGRACCAACSEKRAAGARAIRAADREADRASRSAYRARMRAKRRESGMCTSCGKYPAMTGYRLCRRCRDANRISNGRRKMKEVSGETETCPYMNGLEDLGEYACLHCPRPTCVYDKEDE